MWANIWRRARDLLFGDAAARTERAGVDKRRSRGFDDVAANGTPAARFPAAESNARVAKALDAAPTAPADRVEPPNDDSIGSVIAPISPDSSFSPPAVFGAPRDSRFGFSAAWFRDGPNAGGCVAVMAGDYDGDPARASEINAQRFDPRGGAYGEEIRITKLRDAFEAAAPLVAALDGGRFAVAWIDPSDADGAFRISVHGPEGAPELAGVRIDAARPRGARPTGEAKSIARFADGGFAVSWTMTDAEDPGAGATACLQRFSSAGQPRSLATETPAAASVSVLDEERFVAAWSAPDPSGPGGALVVAALYDRLGVQRGQIVEAGYGAEAGGAAAVGLSDGGFAVLWRGEGSDSIRGRRFDKDGDALTSVFFLPRGAVAATEWGESAFLQLTSDGRLIAIWTENDVRCARPVRILPSTLTQPR